MDGYEGDIIGESTPDALVTEFVSLIFLSNNIYELDGWL